MIFDWFYEIATSFWRAPNPWGWKDEHFGFWPLFDRKKHENRVPSKFTYLQPGRSLFGIRRVLGVFFTHFLTVFLTLRNPKKVGVFWLFGFGKNLKILTIFRGGQKITRRGVGIEKKAWGVRTPLRNAKNLPDFDRKSTETDEISTEFWLKTVRKSIWPPQDWRNRVPRCPNRVLDGDNHSTTSPKLGGRSGGRGQSIHQSHNFVWLMAAQTLLWIHIIWYCNLVCIYFDVGLAPLHLPTIC